MKKRISSTILAVMFLFATGIAWGQDSLYVSLGLGSASPIDSDLNRGPAGTIALGASFDQFRGELEYSHLESDADDWFFITGSISTFSLMANGYFNFINDGPIIPFITAGVGFSRIETKIDAIVPGSVIIVKGSDTAFSYQAGAGIDFLLSESFTVYMMYRYFATTDIFDAGSFSSHNVYIGLRFSF